MALNLMARGHSMAVYARKREALEPLLARGAEAHATPAQMAAHADVIFTMVTGTGDVEQVVLGEGGVLHGARPGTLVIDMSTIAPGATRAMAARLASRGIDMLDAPVSGGAEGARQATLTIMVGGKPEVFEKAKPLFECLGRTILYMGDHGSGHATKACHQLSLLVTAQGVAEALTLARRAGLDVKLVRQALMSGVASSRVLELLGGRMVERDFRPGMETRLYHKDMHIALDTGHSLGCMLPAAALTMQCINALIGRGQGKADLSALITLVEDLAGTR